MSFKLFSLELSVYTRYSNSVRQIRGCEVEVDRVHLKSQQITEITTLGKNILFIASLVSIVAVSKLALLNFVSMAALKGVIVITALVNFIAHQLAQRVGELQLIDLNTSKLKYAQAIKVAQELWKECKYQNNINFVLNVGALTLSIYGLFGGELTPSTPCIFSLSLLSMVMFNTIMHNVGYQVSFLKRS